MKIELFKSKPTELYGGILLVVMFSIEYYLKNRSLLFDQQTVVIFGGSLLILLVGFNSWNTTYLRIENMRTLINSGYKSFGKDTIDISHIKYIYRFPDNALPWVGTRMSIYILSPSGTIYHSALREGNYSEANLKLFLKRIKEIKPTIELDHEYEDFLNGKPLNNPSENTVKEIEDCLIDKGEKF